MADWRSRIVGTGEESADQLLANPSNWRTHPRAQRQALAAVLDDVGWVQQVIVNRVTGHVVDGHLRVELALERGDATVPVLYVELSPDEERIILATFDPIGAMAGTDREAIAALLRDTDASSEALRGVLAGLSDKLVPQRQAGSFSVYSSDEIEDRALDYFNEYGFPYWRIPVHVAMQQINRLAETPNGSLIHTIEAYHVADTYHPHRFDASGAGMLSPYDAFHNPDLLRRAIRLALENGQTVGTEYFSKLDIVSGTQAASNFRPGFAAYIYRRFGVASGRVLDTSTGYGGRLVGWLASRLGGSYLGIDPNTLTDKGNRALAADLAPLDSVTLINEPAEDVDADALADTCDFAFTSPPYFAKEHYSAEDTQSFLRYPTYQDWVNGFLTPTLRLQYVALKAGSLSAINIADVKIGGVRHPLVADTIGIAKALGFEHASTLDFDLHARYGADHEEGKAVEPVLIFRKPGDV